MNDINELVAWHRKEANDLREQTKWPVGDYADKHDDTADALESQQQEIKALKASDLTHREQRDNWRDAYDKAQQEIERLTADRRDLYEDRATILKSQQAKFAQADQRIEQLEAENAQKMDALMQAQQEIERLTNTVNDRDCEIKRLQEFAKKGPYDESAARRAMQYRARIEQLEAALGRSHELIQQGRYHAADAELAALQAEGTDNPESDHD